MSTNRATARILATVLIATAVLAGCGSSESGDDRSSELGEPIIATPETSGSSRSTTTTSTTSARGGSSSDDPFVPGAITFVDPQGTYTIEISPSWTERSGVLVSEIEAWLIGIGDERFQDNVNVLTQDSQGMGLEQYLEFSAANLGGMELVDSRIVTGAAGNRLGLIEYVGDIPGAPVPLHALATVAVDGGKAIVATLTTTTGTFEQSRVLAEPYLMTLQQTAGT